MAKRFMVPVEIRRRGQTGVEILWDDGHHSQYTNEYLRRHCPCAICRMHPPRSLPIVGARAEELHPTQIAVVGRYAVSIQWSDGHDSGIYSYATLRELCCCPLCRPPSALANEDGPTVNVAGQTAKLSTS